MSYLKKVKYIEDGTEVEIKLKNPLKSKMQETYKSRNVLDKHVEICISTNNITEQEKEILLKEIKRALHNSKHSFKEKFSFLLRFIGKKTV